MKKCRKCWVPKVFEEFYRQSDTADGYTNYCRACLIAARKANAAKDSLDKQKRNARRLGTHRKEQRADYQRMYRWKKSKEKSHGKA